jgi:response regulator RpfG family c-di-GMP phosphodiesterase
MNAHVLIVEDEPNVRYQVCGWLRREGHRYAAVDTPEEALEQLDHEPPGVAMLNTRLTDGGTLGRDLRARHRNLALVMMHRLTGESDMPRVEPGVVGYLFKPLVQSEVLESVSDALAWHAVAHRGLIDQTSSEEEMTRRGLALGEALEAVQQATVAALETALSPFAHGCRGALGHAVSVAKWALAMGQVIGVPEPELTELECGAFCHDIGKLALPAALLRNGGVLSPHEVDLVRTHPDIGHDILMMSPALQAVAPIVRGTHERVDGSGFPHGLQGDAIPLAARITAVADAARTLVESRPFRDPITLSAVGAELVGRAGSWFDPDLVAVWLQVAETVDA